MAIQNLRSSSAHKRPIAEVLSAGQIAINTNQASPGLFFKDSNGDLVKVGPVHIGTSAPNSSPATTAADALVSGTVYQILTLGTTDFTAIGASANTVGVVFTATGAGTGTGTVSGQQGVEKGEQWLDTTGGTYVLKIYDGTAWRSESGTFVDVNGDTMTGALGVVAGSESAPGVFFSGDTNTGLLSPGADSVAITTGGTQRIVVDSSGQLGLGTSSPSSLLHVSGQDTTVNISAADGSLSAMTSNTSQIIGFQGGNAEIGLFKDSSGNYSYVVGTYQGSIDIPLVFRTGNRAERMTINSSGNVGIGTSSPAATLHLNKSGTSDYTTLYLSNSGASGKSYQIGVGGNTAGAGYANSLYIYDNSVGQPRAVLDSSGNVGIGTLSPSSALDVSGAISFGSVALPSAGTARIYSRNTDNALYLQTASGNRISFLDGSQNSMASFEPTVLKYFISNTERARIDSSGKLLVGTTSSRSAWNNSTIGSNILQVERAGNGSDTTISITANAGTSSPTITTAGLLFGKTRGTSVGSTTAVASGDCLGRVSYQGSDGTDQVEAAKIEGFVDGTPGANDMPGSLVFSTTADGASSPTSRMTIDSSGRLLLGTTTEGNAFADELTVASSGNTGITIRSGTTSTSALYMSDGTSGADEYRGFVFYDHNSNFMQFGTNAANAMRIDSSGNVGIGTTSPARPLSVSSSQISARFLSSSSDSQIEVVDSSGTVVFGSASGDAIVQAGGYERLRIDSSSGDVGIGTTSNYDDSVLEVRKTAGGDGVAIRVTNNTTTDGSQAGIIFTNSTGDYTSAAIAHQRNDNALIFYNGQTAEGGGFANATERARFDSSGRLLVGTTIARTDFYSGALSADIQIEDSSYCAYSAYVHNGNAAFIFGRGNPINGSIVGNLSWMADDGTDEVEAARISAQIDGTPGSNDMPGRLVFSTTADGASSTTERMRISQDGNVQISMGGSGYATLFRYGTNEDNYIRSGANGITVFGDHNGGERLRIDSSGRLLQGKTSSKGSTGANIPTYCTEIASNNPNVLEIANNGTHVNSYSALVLSRSDSTSVNGHTAVDSGDKIGEVAFIGADGSDRFNTGAAIAAIAQADFTANNCPTHLTFSTNGGSATASERMRIQQNGQIYLSNCTDFYPLSDNSTGLGGAVNRWTAVYAANGTIQTSDSRQKTSVVDAQLGANFIKALRPVSYKWIEGGKRHTGEYDENNNWVYETVPGQRTHWGFIAQEVKQAVDDAGVDFGGWVLTDKDNPDSEQALRYDQFIAPLTKALQEAIAKIETLEQRLSDAGIA